MKKLALVFLFLLSTTSVFAVSEKDTDCSKINASNDQVSSMEVAAQGGVKTPVKGSASSGK